MPFIPGEAVERCQTGRTSERLVEASQSSGELAGRKVAAVHFGEWYQPGACYSIPGADVLAAARDIVPLINKLAVLSHGR